MRFWFLLVLIPCYDVTIGSFCPFVLMAALVPIEMCLGVVLVTHV
jgi:hypothetical protein